MKKKRKQKKRVLDYKNNAENAKKKDAKKKLNFPSETESTQEEHNNLDNEFSNIEEDEKKTYIKRSFKYIKREGNNNGKSLCAGKIL